LSFEKSQTRGKKTKMGTMVLKHVQQPKNLGCQLQIGVGGNLTLDEWGFSHNIVPHSPSSLSKTYL